MFARIREDIASVFERDPAARNTWEVLTCYPGLHAIWAHLISHWLWTHGLRWLARLNSNLARLITGIEIHPGARIGRRFFIDHGMGVVIGETAEIGDDVTLYQGVTLGGTSWNKGKRHPTLGNGVVVGAGAKVLGPFTVGDNARIGSNAVVVKEVPPGATAIGIPGRIVREQAPSEHVQNLAQRYGFDAYGLSKDMPDPVANAFSAMVEHIHKLDERVGQLCKAMHQLDARMPENGLPELDVPAEFGGEPDAPVAKGSEEHCEDGK
ncbi:serine O-acetyltransferase [Sinimarinibacterium sp. CAU 1509]|uniref:serine O-acetyltransferase n=1 Tax=Sinimarinibacterium sp. CAU 1509 TaxID=2562283 RepID=UPI0010AD69B4|nr:serine O-acetyltransferase [Sinimarinibacterium sp. CAU 1509]TJY61970.1 serine O-acetyltransferase [Sinimarinibacterium sp. CAU 1509]